MPREKCLADNSANDPIGLIMGNHMNRVRIGRILTPVGNERMLRVVELLQLLNNVTNRNLVAVVFESQSRPQSISHQNPAVPIEIFEARKLAPWLLINRTKFDSLGGKVGVYGVDIVHSKHVAANGAGF